MQNSFAFVEPKQIYLAGNLKPDDSSFDEISLPGKPQEEMTWI